MRLETIDEYLGGPATGKGPIAVLLCETKAMAAESASALQQRGFQHIIAAGPGFDGVPDAEWISAFPAPIHTARDRTATLNRLIEIHAGRWVLVCFNGDFLFYPFAETRSISDLTEFLGSERRTAIMTYGIDLYSDRMISGEQPTRDDSWFDAQAWYGFERGDGLADVYGGLGWRYEEYVPVATSRVNRPALFQARAGLRIGDDLWLDEDVMNTVACPWHNNPTMALMTTRRARMLLEHPNFKSAVTSLIWPKSEKFKWQSEQLVQHGLIEAGQWM